MTMSDAPKRLEQPDFTALIALLEEGMEHVLEYKREPKDFEYGVYEETMTAFYGPAYWDFINDVLEDQ